MQAEQANKSSLRHSRKVRTGVVTSDKMDKTVVVSIKRVTKDRFFDKIVRVEKTVKAHDEKNECKVGDKVQIVETRPLSKTKRWRVQKLLLRATEDVG